MTFADEPFEIEEQEIEEPANYPSAFGITFTPQISGIALAVLGILGAGYVFLNFVMPAYQNYQQLQSDRQNKEDQVNSQQPGAIEKRIQETQIKLQKAQNIKSDVLSLFSNENTLDTLLIDINKFVGAKNAKLINYKPQGSEPVVINDGSLGTLVNNKLKRQTITLEMEGTYEQTQAILRDIERLQPLLLVKNMTSESTISPFIVTANQQNNRAQLISLPSLLKTQLTFDVVLPLTSEESAKLATPPDQANQPEQK
jgi:cell fate (sporulation/competence/biofilm development) regulator YlbF (YheA/YmcA/DUF963 family)